MSTKAQIRFATREEGQSFSKHPEKIHAQFYVHHDSYPEGLGLNIAESILNKQAVDVRSSYYNIKWEIEELQTLHGDLKYIYYIWQAYDKETFISIFKDNTFRGYCEECDQLLPSKLDECIFVGTPEQLIEKYTN